MRIWSYGEENKTLIRVPTPYYKLETVAFIRKDSGIKINQKEDLKNYRLIKRSGVKHTDNITQNMPYTIDVDSTEKMMRRLQHGRGDIAITNKIDGVSELKRLGITNIAPVDLPLATLDLYHYLHKKHADLVPQIDRAIKAIKTSGALTDLSITIEHRVVENYNKR